MWRGTKKIYLSFFGEISENFYANSSIENFLSRDVNKF